MSRKTWDLVVNNYTEADISKLNEWGPEVTRMVVAKEVGEECGTPHLQCRMTFKRNYTLSALKKLAPRWHWEPTIAAHDSLYCMKTDSNVVINIDNRRQGARSDIAACVDKIKNGATKRQMMDEHPVEMVKFMRMYDSVRAIYHPSVTKPEFDELYWPLIDDWSRSVVVVGKSGIGKTNWAKQNFPEGSLFVSTTDQLAEFDPSIHQGIIFDDMSFSHWPRSAQIHLVDQSDDRNIKIRYVDAHIPAHTKKIFTTNVREIFSDDEAINRRIRFVELHRD